MIFFLFLSLSAHPIQGILSLLHLGNMYQIHGSEHCSWCWTCPLTSSNASFRFPLLLLKCRAPLPRIQNCLYTYCSVFLKLSHSIILSPLSSGWNKLSLSAFAFSIISSRDAILSLFHLLKSNLQWRAQMLIIL